MLQFRSRLRSARQFVALAVFASTLAFTSFASAQQVTTIAGGFVGDGLNASEAGLNLPGEVAFDASGNLYVADVYNHRVRKVTPAGVVSTYAGTGESGYGGDGGSATLAKLNAPWGLAFDASGNLYISEWRGNRIRKVTPGGVISTVAGDGSTNVLNGPRSLEIAPNGTLYVSEPGTNRVRKVVGGVVSAFAGAGGNAGSSGDGGPATSAHLTSPLGLLVQADGSVLIADTGNNRVRRVDSSGNISLWRSIHRPYGFAKDASGSLHVTSDYGIFKDSGSSFVLEAGDAQAPWGFSGDGPVSTALFDYPSSIAFAADDRLFVSDQYNDRIRVISNGSINTYMGPGRSSEGLSALGARVGTPGGLVYDAAGNLFVAERYLNTIRKISPAGVISTFAGNGLSASAAGNGDGGPPLAAAIYEPRGLAIAPNGDLLVAQYGAGGVRRITPGGLVSTVGIGDQVGAADQITTDSAGNIYVSGYLGIARVSADYATAALWVGNGETTGTYPENVPASQTPTGSPGQMGFDAAGNFYYADSNFHTVRKVTPGGLVSTVAGVPGVSGNDGDGGAATAAHLLRPHALVVEADGSFIVGDDNGRFRRVSNGTIQALAGAATNGYNGDGAASSTMFDVTTSATRAADGSLVIADQLNQRIRSMPFGDPSLPGISISDAAITEGDSGSKSMTFTVSLSSPASSNVTFNIATSDATATAGSDYVSLSLSGQTIAAGQSSKSFSVPIAGDTNFELDETFQIAISGVTGAKMVDWVGAGVIQNDDAAPVLTIADVSMTEGDAGTKTMTFTVTASYAPLVPITFGIATVEGTATDFGQGSDYLGSYLPNETIDPGTTSRTYSVTVNGDTTFEPDETFLVQVVYISNATMPDPEAQGTILNDDGPPPPPTFSISDADANEGDSGETNLPFSVTFSRPTEQEVTFTLTTSDITATAGSDYVAQSKSYTVPVGTTFFYPVVAVNGDHLREADETLGVSISNLAGATIGNVEAIGTIRNDDLQQPGGGGSVITLEDAWVPEGNSGQRNAYVTVRLSQPSTEDIWFAFGLTDGTATLGQDYLAPSSQDLWIEAGTTVKTFAIPLIGDTAVEGNENFFVTIHSHMYGSVDDDQAIVTIVDDESGPPPLMLSVTDAVYVYEGDAGTQTMTFYANLSAASSSPVTVDLQTVDGTAVAGSDYVQKTGQVVIPAGERSASFTVTTTGDNEIEADEQLAVQASNASGAVIVDAIGQGVIWNDDGVGAPEMTIADASISEGDSGTKQLTFTVTISEALTSVVTFNATTSDGTAFAGSDYVAATLYGLSIPAGQTSATFSITVNGDTQVESDESFRVSIYDATGVVITDGFADGLILNDDIQSGPTLSIGDVSIAEGNSLTKTATFTVTLSAAQAGPVLVDVATANGTATAGSDYVAKTTTGLRIPAGATSKTFAVTINGDTTSEPDETFTVNLSNASGATIADAQGLGTITNDDGGGGSTPTLSIGDVSMSEGNSGSKTATFTVSLSAAASSTVSFDVATANGTATAGSDYVALALTGQSITAGQTSKTVSVTINGDTTVEADETFNVTVSNVSGATVADGSAVGTITNDDAAAGPTLSINDVSVAEGNSATKTATFTVTLSAAQSGAVTVDVATANGTATAGSDYVAKTTAGLRIAAGTTSKTFAVTINGDTTSESDETYTVNLSNASGATIADGQGLGTITNDDAAATPTLSIADASVTEGNTGTKTLTFTVSLSPAASGTVTYNIATSNGTATAGSDYVASTLTGQTISAGATSKTFVVTINGDTTNEANETFNVTLSNVSGATLGDGAAVGTITNDDSSGGGPTLSIGDVSIAEGNSLSKQATFTVTLSAPASTAVTYTIATANGTAVAPTDYTAKSLSGQSIPAGSTSKTFSVAVKGDKTVEPNETFLVNVTSVTGATVADGQAVGTITNDDAAALTVARFDAKGLVDDVDDGNQQPQIAPSEYATLLADSATTLCRRAPEATVIAVEGVEHKQVLADLADAANAVCTGKPSYTAVMADNDSRGFLIQTPAKDEVGTTVLGEPEVNANAKSTALSILGAGHAKPVTLVLADGTSKALLLQLQQRARVNSQEALVLLGANVAKGFVDVTARQVPRSTPVERVLVNSWLLRQFGAARVEFPVQVANDPPAQILELQ